MKTQEQEFGRIPKAIQAVMDRNPVLPHEEILRLFALRVPGFKPKKVGTNADGEDIMSLQPAMVLPQEAFEAIYLSNMRLAVKQACHYRIKGLDIEDLITEGGLGLRKAINRFDPSQGNQFSTVASFWVQKEIGRYVEDQATQVRVPYHVQWDLRHLKQARNRLLQSLGREPHAEELLAEFNRMAKKAVPPRKEKSLDQVHDLLKDGVARHVEIDRPRGDDEETGTLDAYVSSETDPGRALDREYLLELLAKARGKLSQPEQAVIALRFPKNGEGPRRTLEEAAEELATGGMGVTRQRIQQIEAAALAKMMGFMRSQGITQEAFAEMVA